MVSACFFGKLQTKSLNYAKEEKMSKKQTRKLSQISVEQFAEFSASVTRCLPKNIDPVTAQRWISHQQVLTRVLSNALMSPEEIKSLIFKADEKFRVGTTDGVKISFASLKFEGLEEEMLGKTIIPQKVFDTEESGYLFEIINYARKNQIKLTTSTLSGIWNLLRLHVNTQKKSQLLIDRANIFFVKLNGILFGVEVKWYGNDFLIPTHLVSDHMAGWCHAGTRVFSGGDYSELCVADN